MSNDRWKSILVVIADPFAQQQPALTKAVAIGLASGAKLVLFNSFMVPQPVADVAMDSQSQIIASAIRQRRERMRSLAADFGLRGAKCIVEWDYPAHEAIVRQVLTTKPDLLLTASHRRGRLARLLLANTDWELMRTCPCPVWFVRSAELPQRPHIVVAVDPFHAHEKPASLDDRLIGVAAAVVRRFDGHITLVHAFETSALMQPVRSMAVARAKKEVADLAARHAIRQEYCEVRAGQPEEVVPSFVRKEDADILVMGVVSRTLKERPVIGNTAEHVIDRVDCDVLVIKPAGFKAPTTRPIARAGILPRSKMKATRRRSKRSVAVDMS